MTDHRAPETTPKAYLKIFDESPSETEWRCNTGEVEDANEDAKNADSSRRVSTVSPKRSSCHVRDKTNIIGGSESSEEGERAAKATYP
jgi:hypothetical protein